jgi:hypothetical protein
MRTVFPFLLSALAGCAAEPDDDESNGSENQGDGVPDDTEEPPTEAELFAALTGEWHGEIGPGYKFGCLCLTLDETGAVIHPSGITMGFQVTDAGGTTIVSLEDREIDIATRVEGSTFHIQEAILSEDSSLIEGEWVGQSAFDSTIVLDREPATCEDRTGLWGAPC